MSPPWELAIKEPYFVSDTPGSEILHGHRNTLRSQIISNADQEVKFSFILQMRDMNGSTLGIITAERNISARGNSEISMYWQPNQHGEFKVDIFLWSDLENPLPLSGHSIPYTITVK